MQVWAALCTKEGLESWNVAHADVDLKVGGKMLTHYDPKGKLGDPNTIENLILSFEPRRMLSIKVGHCPEKFPFKNAIKTVWQVHPLRAHRADDARGCRSSAWDMALTRSPGSCETSSRRATPTRSRSSRTSLPARERKRILKAEKAMIQRAVEYV